MARPKMNTASGGTRDLTMGAHAEAWAEANGRHVPRRNTKVWQKMYEDWHAYAFEYFPNRAPGDE